MTKIVASINEFAKIKEDIWAEAFQAGVQTERRRVSEIIENWCFKYCDEMEDESLELKLKLKEII